tara:strand:+ start:698 stop:1534 length:837 start_codon:yes stop_codon:yes gene_type:complete
MVFIRKGIQNISKFYNLRVCHSTFNNNNIGLVPIIGSFHKGHENLIQNAVEECDNVIVSFNHHAEYILKNRYYRKTVSQTQFQTQTNFNNFQNDIIYLKNNFTNLKFIECSMNNEYTCNFTYEYQFLIEKLIDAKKPNKIYYQFHELDECSLLHNIVNKSFPEIHLRLLPVERYDHGLAYSSRNIGLSKTQFRDASIINHALETSKKMIYKGENYAIVEVKHIIIEELHKSAFVNDVDIDLIQFPSMEKVEHLDSTIPTIIALRAHYGDNILVDHILI